MSPGSRYRSTAVGLRNNATKIVLASFDRFTTMSSRRESQGQFAHNVEVGEWTRWAADGSVEAVNDHGQGNSRLADSFQAPEDPFAKDAESPAMERSPHSRRVTKQRASAKSDEDANDVEEEAVTDEDEAASILRAPTFSTARPYGHKPAASGAPDDGPMLGEPTPAIR